MSSLDALLPPLLPGWKVFRHEVKPFRSDADDAEMWRFFPSGDDGCGPSCGARVADTAPRGWKPLLTAGFSTVSRRDGRENIRKPFDADDHIDASDWLLKWRRLA